MTNINIDAQKSPHLLLSQANYGVTFVRIMEETNLIMPRLDSIV